MHPRHIVTGDGLDIHPLPKFGFRLNYLVLESRGWKLNLNPVHLRGRLGVLPWNRLIL